MKSQSEQILKALQKGNKITPLDAISRWNCFRLGGRIYDLREAGHNITTEMVKSSSGKRYAQYSLDA